MSQAELRSIAVRVVNGEFTREEAVERYGCRNLFEMLGDFVIEETGRMIRAASDAVRPVYKKGRPMRRLV